MTTYVAINYVTASHCDKHNFAPTPLSLLLAATEGVENTEGVRPHCTSSLMCFSLFQINFNDYLLSLQLARACDTELGPSSADTEVGSGR